MASGSPSGPLPDEGDGDYGEMSGVSVASNPMLNAKLTRRKVQQDMELLSNRIERLRAEERKAKQKVVETKMRGQEIISMQKRNEQQATARELAKRVDQDQRQRESQQQQLRRAEHRSALKSTFEAMHSTKRDDVRIERRIKLENAEALKQAREYELERARKAKIMIREHQKEVKTRFDKQRQAHQEFLAQDFINMIAMEDKRREDIEREIAAMEIEERQHIERLRALQEEQKAAYDGLEQALAS